MTGTLLSAQSRRLWHQERSESRLQVLLQPDCFLFGDLDPEKIAQVLTRLMERHEALRMGVIERAGEPYAVDGIPTPPTIVTDFVGADDETWQRAIEREGGRHQAQLLAAPAGSPLCRFTILRRSAQEHALVATLHHLVTDGWSIALLVREFLAMMDGATLTSAPLQFTDFMRRERADLSQPDSAERLRFWANQLATPDTAWERFLETGSDAATDPNLQILGAEAAVAVDHLAVLARASRFAVLLTCFAVALGKALQTPVVRIGIPAANRSGVGMSGVCGLLATTLLVDLSWSAHEMPVPAIQRTRQALEAAVRRRVPLALILERLQDGSYLRQGELAHAQFNMLPIRESMLRSNSMRVVPALIRPISTTSQQDISVIIVDTELGLLVAESHRLELHASFVAQVMQEFALLPMKFAAAS